MLNALAIILHLLAINIWVGGTFFTVVVLPRATITLVPTERHRFMQIVLKRFFFWVWLALIVVLSSGGAMIYRIFGGMTNIPLYVLLMMSMALLMAAVFLLIYFWPYRLFTQSLDRGNEVECEKQLIRVRLLSKINMTLGIAVLMVIGGGPLYR